MDLIRVDFHGNELSVVEKDGVQFVAMKPIVEALGLDWTNQYLMIKKDEVLNQGIVVTTIPTASGNQEMVCLQLDYLNGWLFKVPASRYKGKKKESIIAYQKECYHALYNHFHQPRANASDIVAAVRETMMVELRRNAALEHKVRMMSHFMPKGNPGEISESSGMPKVYGRRGCWVSRNGRNISVFMESPELPGLFEQLEIR